MFFVRSGVVVQCVVLWWHVCGAVMTEADIAGDGQNSTKGVDEFLTSLTQMIGAVLQSDGRYSQSLVDGAQSVSGRPNRPPGAAPADYFETGRPPYPPPPPPYSENGPRPPYFENGPRPPYVGQYPQQNSVLQALTSISRHDDLRCVPRLLCEVSSGTRPSSPGYYQPGGYYQQQQQQPSTIPFLSKDALNTLLTVLTFVDDSPLLMFGRATLLGYNSRGDARSCTDAYPTCPRNPDQLLDYLNNHKGGFFRFFNQQPPHRPPFPPQQPPFPPQQPPFPPQRPLYPPQRPPFPPQQQYAAQYPRPRKYSEYGGRADRNNEPDDQRSPRILSGSADQYFDVPAVNDLLLDVPRPPMKFPSDGHNEAANSVAPFTFPSSDRPRRGKSNAVKMVFPDRTGTGGLRAELDQYGNYKGAYYADGAIKFVDDHRRPSGVRLPSAQSGPADHFDVIGDRLPYGKQSKFQFPRSESA